MFSKKLVFGVSTARSVIGLLWVYFDKHSYLVDRKFLDESVESFNGKKID